MKFALWLAALGTPRRALVGASLAIRFGLVRLAAPPTTAIGALRRMIVAALPGPILRGRTMGRVAVHAMGMALLAVVAVLASLAVVTTVSFGRRALKALRALRLGLWRRLEPFERLRSRHEIGRQRS
ncbi:MAG: hypothetical protein ACJ8FC_11340, partial [Sphingomicrobium sp.]